MKNLFFYLLKYYFYQVHDYLVINTGNKFNLSGNGITQKEPVPFPPSSHLFYIYSSVSALK